MHPSATASPIESARHTAFIGQALLVGFAALAVAPFFLAFHGAPTLGEALVFACALGQVGAATLVARTGRLALGEGVGFCCLVGIGIGLLVGARAGAGCALAWLAVAQLETALWLDKRRELCAGLVSATALAGIVAAAAMGRLPAQISPGASAAIAGLAVVVAAATARRLSALTARMRTSQEQRADRDAVLAAALGDAIVGFDTGGSVVELCGGCEAFLGAPDHEVLGRGLFEHVHVADRPAFLTAVADAARGDATVEVGFRLRLWDTNAANAAEPRHIAIDMRARRLAAGGGTRPMVLAVLRDVTLEQARDVEVAEARRSREDVVRSKDHFLASMSHELRTPLNAIIGFSEMLGSHTLRPGDADKQREYARVINQAGQHLLGVVNSILDMSKLQSGQFAILAEPFDIVPLIDLCCETVAPQAQAGGLRVVRDYPAALEEVVGDKRAYKQILVNLLSNAVKFTPAAGQVTLWARPEGSHLVFRVTDSGSGIAACDLSRLGDPFVQARASASRSRESQVHPGTGLGLSVVRGLVGLHGGALTIESEPGMGTSVTVRLPLDCRAVRADAPVAAIETISRHAAPTASRRMKLSA